MIKGGDVVVVDPMNNAIHDIPSCDLCVATSIALFAMPDPEPDPSVAGIKYRKPDMEEGVFNIDLQYSERSDNEISVLLSATRKLDGGALALKIDPDKWEFVRDIPVNISDKLPVNHGYFDLNMHVWKYSWVSCINGGYKGPIARVILRKRKSEVGAFEGIHLVDEAPFNYAVVEDKLYPLIMSDLNKVNNHSGMRLIATPNPFNDIVHLAWLDEVDDQPYHIEVFTVSGQKLFEKDYRLNPMNPFVSIDLSPVNAEGMLIARVTHGEELDVLKLLKK